ncbi:zinc-ribbon-domain-containing protein [Dichotomocladium elegans]|nr:zinc-ribbon-domain-containing protein [Dichotomocladium elegans]
MISSSSDTACCTIVTGSIDTRLADLSPLPCSAHSKAFHEEARLRKAIRDICGNGSLDAAAKAKKIQNIMCRPTSKPLKPNNPDVEYAKSFYDPDKGILGCQHYCRKSKIQAACCGKIYPCRFCHDQDNNHVIDRHATKNMVCMLCRTLQPAAQHCGQCKAEMARYYCSKCKFWDDLPGAQHYHCDACKICRRGLEVDYFHCDRCNVCLTMTMRNNHRCIERSLESDCPICGEYMFTSTTPATFLRCGHAMHTTCFADYSRMAYQCPICLKSMADMSAYFDHLDRTLALQPMPAEYSSTSSLIFCNDCEKRSEQQYHFFFRKCCHCSSFNTILLSTFVKTSP